MNDLPIDMLPEEAEAAEQARLEKLAAKVEAFGNSLVKKRDDAVNGRKASGVEEEWLQAEDAYQGIDDANRGEGRMGKPSSPNGGYINGPVKSGAVRSSVYLNITRPYTDAAAAKVSDMLLPTDDTPWSIKPTPIPEMEKALQMLEQPGPGMPYQPATSMPIDPAGAMGGMPGGPPPAGPAQGAPQQAAPAAPQVSQVQSAIEQMKAQAKKAAEGATTQISDWLTECRWHGEVRKLIEDCARLGTGIIKGPFPTKRTNRVTKQADGLMAMVIEQSIAPASKCISPWNFYPDPACGESIHEGNYCWERDTITGKALKDLKGLPGYLDSQIDKVLEEGPGKKFATDTFNPGNVKAKDDDQFEIWYFHGTADREDLEAAGVDIPEDGDVSCPALITVVNDCVIKAALQPLDDGEFPYDVMPWQRKPGVPWGTGVAMQVNTPQRMLNAATRNMMDNAGYSAGPQLIMRRDAISPADGIWQMTPRKIWFVNDGADVNAVNQAFMAINIPTLQGELMNIIQFALKMAEDVTGLPMLLQGQQGKAPETVGGMQMLANNASVVLRRIARLFDDHITRPHLTRYYQWLMTYGEDDEVKGDFQIEVRGSTALVERDLQTQSIMQMGQMVMNPAFGIDPEKWATEYLKALKLDPKSFTLDEEKKAQMQQMQQPQAPQIQVAQIRAQADMQKTQMQLQAKAQADQAEQQLTLQRIQADTDRDSVYVQSETQRTQLEHQARMQELALKRELEMLKYANANQIKLEDIKAALAREAMKINATRELAGMKASADQLPKPPIEPPGRAQPGMSFQQ